MQAHVSCCGDAVPIFTAISPGVRLASLPDRLQHPNHVVPINFVVHVPLPVLQKADSMVALRPLTRNMSFVERLPLFEVDEKDQIALREAAQNFMRQFLQQKTSPHLKDD